MGNGTGWRRRGALWPTVVLLAAAWILTTGPAAAAGVLLEDLTWTELQARIGAGATTALLPVGGTEQSGPHMALGKHNVRVRLLAARIAERLGDAIVAPVLAYVPEGGIDPPTQHMRWPGTISVPVPAFEAVLEAGARSLCRAGFRHVFLLGDHGGYAASLQRVATRLRGAQGATAPCRVQALDEYYRAAQEPFQQALAERGLSRAEIGSHAGVADTSLMLALDPSLVRLDLAAARPTSAADGVSGDPRRSSAELGRLGVDRIVDTSVAAVRERILKPR